jgi:hypothetical protein
LIKSQSLCIVLLSVAPVCFGQSTTATDPTDDQRGLPLYLRALPKPEPEPWSKITFRQRWEQYVALTFSPTAALGSAAGAAISQGIDSPTEWGQGWEAYGIRVASSYGATLVGNTVMASTAAMFHDDNRYFRSKSDRFGSRLGHVILSPYVARNDEGGKRFSTSMFLGSAAYSGVQLAWSPQSWQGWNNVGINYLIWYGQAAGFNLVREFYPSMVRKFRKNHSGSTLNAPASPSN